MQLPGDLRAMLDALRRVARPRLVGGGVRDALLGLDPKDFDIEVAGIDFDTLHRTLAPFGATDVVGRSFGVIKVRSAVTGAEYDFSLPRRESKTGAGHRGFAVAPDPSLSDADAAARRDFTLNAIAQDPFTDELIDPHNGRRDLEARILRHTSPAFIEDPLRVLRAVQLAARFDLTLAPETAALCRSIAHTFSELPVERVWGEWEKWASKSIRPSRGLVVLEETNWLRHFPEIAALRGTPQDPEWHPEGDVFNHTQHCLDALATFADWQSSPQRALLTFAVLGHDFGKPSTTQKMEKDGRLRWRSPGHHTAGGPLAKNFLRRIGAPLAFDDPVCALVENHHAHDRGNQPFTDRAIRRLALRLAPATIHDLSLVMRADALGRPPYPAEETLARIEELLGLAAALAFKTEAPRPILLGRHLISLGFKPGPGFTPVLNAAFDAQLDGAFSGESGAMTWLQARLLETKGELR